MDESQKILQHIESVVDNIIKNKNNKISSLEQKNKNINTKLYKILKKLNQYDNSNNKIEQFEPNYKKYNLLKNNRKIILNKTNFLGI